MNDDEKEEQPVPETDAENPAIDGDVTPDDAESGGNAESAPDAPPVEPSPEEQISDLNDKLLRALAELENLRRRSAKEREDALKYGISGFARDMLGIADNLGRAMSTVSDDAQQSDSPVASLIEGVSMTERALVTALERHGITKITPEGEKFTAELHEAMFEVPTDDHPPGTVVQVVEAGYMVHDRLLRPARVGVAKPASEPPPKVDTTA